MTPKPPIPPMYNPATVNVFANDYWLGLGPAQTLYMEELARYKAYLAYLMAVGEYKANSEQRIANGLPLLPEPIPPAGYAPVVTPPPVKPPTPSTVVQPKSSYGVYPAMGDPNPAGTVIDNPFLPGEEKLVKVIDTNPFGSSHYWKDV